MAQLVVRDLDDDLKERLKARARLRGHSMEEEVRQVLREAVEAPPPVTQRLGSRIAARFSRFGTRAASVEIEEWRGFRPKPVRF